MCLILGTIKIENFNQNFGALSVKLTPAEMVELKLFVSKDVVEDDRYMANFATWETSETPSLSSWRAT